MDLMWIAVIVGGAVGITLSVVFGIYSKGTADSYVKSFFGIRSTDLIIDAIILILAASAIFLATVAGVVKDVSYPVSKPINFTIETLLMAFLPAVVFLIMAPLRGYKVTGTTFGEFSVLVVKFGILHLLLQFSGFYSNVFPPK